MTGDLDALYRGVVLDHYKQPRNRRPLDAGSRAEGHNPLCGDRLTVYVRVEDGRVEDAAFEGFGCAIATASASLMTESVRRKTVGEATALACRFEAMVSAPSAAPIDDLGGLSALAGVRRFPVRIKCALLPWRALLAAIGTPEAVVSTESPDSQARP